MRVPHFEKIGKTRPVGISVKQAYRQTYGIKYTQFVTERIMKTELFKHNKNFVTKRNYFKTANNCISTLLLLLLLLLLLFVIYIFVTNTSSGIFIYLKNH